MHLTSSPTISRRHFFQQSVLAGSALAVGLGRFPGGGDAVHAEDRPSFPVDVVARKELRVLLHEHDGAPLERERSRTLHARDLANDPLPQTLASATGRSRVELASEPLQLSCRLAVPGFGEVYCYADNEGAGFSHGGTIEFVVEAAATRLRRVREAWASAQSAGLSSSPKFTSYLDKAQMFFQRAVPRAGSLSSSAGEKKWPVSREKVGDNAARIAAAYESLAHSLHAGEWLVLNLARHRIQQFSQPRAGFLFGCLSSGWQRGGEFEKHLRQAFNHAAITWYAWQNENPPEQRINYGRMDEALHWCEKHQIIPKGYGYVYLTPGATPEWFRQWPFEKVLPEYRRIVTETGRRYDGRIPYVEVINEAHDKANLFRFSQAQILELTREACRALREGSKTMQRQINHCCLWAEYAQRRRADGARRWSPFRYLRDCVKAGVEFEIVGLQLYYPQQDLFEIERMLDRFTFFQRPIHITELACNSAEGLDPASLRPQSLVPGWHGPWNETRQADWLEAIYTLCYSKPQIQAIGWWDLADGGGHFWPHGGLLRRDFHPKESYHRLLQLQQQWGWRKG